MSYLAIIHLYIIHVSFNFTCFCVYHVLTVSVITFLFIEIKAVVEQNKSGIRSSAPLFFLFLYLIIWSNSYSLTLSWNLCATAQGNSFIGHWTEPVKQSGVTWTIFGFNHHCNYCKSMKWFLFFRQVELQWKVLNLFCSSIAQNFQCLISV